MSITETLTTTAITTDGIPSAGTYDIDPSHTHVGFAVKHFGLSKTRGEFGTVSGTITIAEDVTESSVAVEIDAASFASGDDTRDGHVKGADFLDVETYPTLTFRSTGLVNDGGDWKLTGELMVKDVTRPVELDVEFDGETVDPFSNDRIAFSATTKIDRTEFGVTWNQALETGGLVVGRSVAITLDVEATRPA